MDIITRLNTFVLSKNSNESIVGLIKQKVINEGKKESFIPESYYYLTNLVNPITTYLSRKYKGVKISNDILRRLYLGKRLERMAGYWFRNIPEFITEQGKLDGAFVGIPRVRGAIDFRIGNKIIEFKTKDQLPSDSEEIFQKYPQDVEQIAFYSVLDTIQSNENYLIFMNNTAPYKIKAFKVKTNKYDLVKSILINRINMLDSAIKSSDYSKLGRCRYHPNCQFNENKICQCDNMNQLSIKSLKDGLSISYDSEFTKLLESEIEKSNIIKEFFTTINMIAPRKCLMERKLGLDSDYTPNISREAYISFLNSIIRKLDFNLTNSQNDYIKKMKKEERMYIAQRWLSVPTSTNKQGYELLPYTMGVGSSDELTKLNKPTPYNIAELAIICATYKKQKGLIFTIHPKINDEITVSEVIFKDSNGILDIIKEVIDNLEKSLENEDIFLNEACPEWMNDKGKCPLMTTCHSKDGKGCVKTELL